MADYRNVWVLVAAVTLLQVGGGILGVLTPLGLQEMGTGSSIIGVIAALNAVGFMIGAAIAPNAIRVFGNIRIYAAAAATAAVTVLLMHLALNVFAWGAIRLLQGISLALTFSSIEAWLGAAVPTAKRGRVGGFYHLMAKVALIIGPFFVAGASALEAGPYMWGAIFLGISLLPICLTRRGQPPAPDREALSLRQLFVLAPAGVIAAFLAGVVNTGVLSLLPIYAVLTAPTSEISDTGLAAIFVGATWVGGLISQWPAGRLSDRFDRRSVIGVMGLFAAGAATALTFNTGFSLPVVIILLGVWGAGSLSFYGVAVAHIIDWCPPGKIAQAMAGILFIWAMGSVAGPLLAGAALQTPLGAPGLFAMAAIFGAILTLAMIWRRAARGAPPQVLQEPWNPATPTLATRGEIDPRTE